VDVGIKLRKPYLLFLGSETQPQYAKTAFGIRDWVPDVCVGQVSLPGATVNLGLPTLTPEEGAARGARSLVIGVAPVGGSIPAGWIPFLVRAAEAGLDVVSGMHTRLTSIPRLVDAATQHGVRLLDVRHADCSFPVATGVRRSGKRLLTVGTDCALGKKYTALAIAQELTRRGRAATFRASGQTGIMISGSGIAIDAVVSDFIAGAAELLSPANHPDHWDVVEGQGSIFHPAYAAVSLGLLHGTQPDAIVLCHEPMRTRVLGFPEFPVPELLEAIALHLQLAGRLNPAVRCFGISLNTSGMTRAERDEYNTRVRKDLSLPVVDPIRDGVKEVVDLMEAI
jgi:D-glutamate N-acetyltransferase